MSDSLEKESSVVLFGGMQSDRSATSSPPPKRSRMDKRLVCGIDEALEPENFEEMELPTTKKTYTTYLGPTKKRNVEKVLWTEEQPTTRGRQRLCDVIRSPPGLNTQAARSAATIGEASNLFFSEWMMDLVLASTNLKIDETLSKQTEEALHDDTKPYLRKTDACELRAVFRLMYFRD